MHPSSIQFESMLSKEENEFRFHFNFVYHIHPQTRDKEYLKEMS